MDKPKQLYKRPEARTLRSQPCPECQLSSRPRLTPMPDLTDPVDPDVLVAWHCPNNLCPGSDGFWIESR